MKTVVAFTNNQVQILCGEGDAHSIQISRVIDVPFEINCVMGGVITDTEAFTRGIQAVWAGNDLPKKGVILSLDGNNIKSKKTVVPKVSPQKTAEIIVREFQEIEVLAKPVFSYVISDVRPGGSREITAFGAEQEFVENLLRFFATMGIKVAGIVSARCAIIQLLASLKFIAGKNCILQAVNAETLVTVLVEGGHFVNLSSTRVFSQHGSEAFGAEVARNVSQLLQFQRSERSTNLATEVYMAGFTPEDAQVCTAQIQALSLQVQAFSGGDSIKTDVPMSGSLFLHAGTLALEKTQGNLYTAYVAHKRDVKKKDKLLLKILPVLVVVAVLAAISSSMVIGNMGKTRRLEKLNAYLTDPANLAAQQEYDSLIEKAAALNRQVRVAAEIQQALDSYPFATSGISALIAQSGQGLVQVRVTSYSADTGTLSFTATGKDAEKINQFVKALSDTGVFYGVQYGGYSGGATGEYIVDVSCTLSAGAGR